MKIQQHVFHKILGLSIPPHASLKDYRFQILESRGQQQCSQEAMLLYVTAKFLHSCAKAIHVLITYLISFLHF